MSSFQPNSLPDGYSLRLAIEEDTERILYFSFQQAKGLLYLLILISLSIWSIIHISDDKPRTIYTIIVGLILLGISLHLYSIDIGKSIKGKPRVRYILEYDNILCGVVDYLIFDSFVFITCVSIDDKHRNKGLGSIMVQYCMDTIENPMYLKCSFDLKTFYERLGFVIVGRSRIPSELSRFISSSQHFMVFDDTQY